MHHADIHALGLNPGKRQLRAVSCARLQQGITMPSLEAEASLSLDASVPAGPLPRLGSRD